MTDQAMHRADARADAQASAPSVTHGRTDGLTEMMAKGDLSSTTLNARTLVEETFTILGRVVDAGVQRWPIARSGERTPLHRFTRLGVYRRDDSTCQECHHVCIDEGQVDHVIPWSTGGSDWSDNLRVLCGPCNQRRSNFNDGAQLTTYAPVALWCLRCGTESTLGVWWERNPDDRPPARHLEHDVAAYCLGCKGMGRSAVVL